MRTSAANLTYLLAMSGSSTLSSTWMLSLLLLPLFIPSHQSFPASVPDEFSIIMTEEFSTVVTKFGETVKNCAENCSSGAITDEKCRCFNVSGACGFPEFFSERLKYLHDSISKEDFIVHLTDFLTPQSPSSINTSISFCSMPVMSPKCLHTKLEHLMQYVNSNSQLNLLTEAANVNCSSEI